MELSQESRAAERFVRLTAPSASNPTRQRARRRSFPFRTLTASTPLYGMYYRVNMSFRSPIVLTDPAAFFREPRHPRQRQYEALRAYYVEGCSSQAAARAFGYSPGAFRVLCHAFLRDPPARFLCCFPHRPPVAAQKVRRLLPGRRLPQAEPLRLRNQSGPEGTPNSP